MSAKSGPPNDPGGRGRRASGTSDRGSVPDGSVRLHGPGPRRPALADLHGLHGTAVAAEAVPVPAGGRHSLTRGTAPESAEQTRPAAARADQRLEMALRAPITRTIDSPAAHARPGTTHDVHTQRPDTVVAAIRDAIART